MHFSTGKICHKKIIKEHFIYIICSFKGGVLGYENDFSAKDQTEIKGPWFSCKNEDSWRTQSISSKKKKRKKAVISLRPQSCGLFPYAGKNMKFSESLKNNIEFQNVYKHGRSVADRLLVMYVMENNTSGNRIGISVSKKIGNSVVRHHFCRLIREIYRLHENIFNSGLDIVVVARKSAADADYHDFERSFMNLAKRHNIIPDTNDKNTRDRNL